MMLFIPFILFGWLLISCGPNEIAPEFQPHVDSFIKEVNNYCPEDRFLLVGNIKFGDFSDDGAGEVGRCYLYPRRDIHIDRIWWNKNKEMHRYLIYHEMTHCMLGLEHINSPPFHYMNENQYGMRQRIKQDPELVTKQLKVILEKICLK